MGCYVIQLPNSLSHPGPQHRYATCHYQTVSNKPCHWRESTSQLLAVKYEANTYGLVSAEQRMLHHKFPRLLSNDTNGRFVFV